MLVLVASVQVPARLGWKQDIAKLTPVNQKVFWVYSGYILLCIVSFFRPHLPDHSDWPPGNSLMAGHGLVTTLFFCLGSVYWLVALSMVP